MFNIGQLPIAWGYAGAMGGTQVYVYELLHRSGFVEGGVNRFVARLNFDRPSNLQRNVKRQLAVVFSKNLLN